VSAQAAFAVSEEVHSVVHAHWSTGLGMLLFFNGCLSILLSLTAFWVLSETTPTTYSIVGQVNKVSAVCHHHHLLLLLRHFTSAVLRLSVGRRFRCH
jgi:hypothetical protein